MFYDVFIKLCDKKGVTPAGFSADTGIAQSTISMWKKNGATPTSDKLSIVARYFNTTTDYLLTGYLLTGEQEKALAQGEGELSIEERADQILAGISSKSGDTLMLDGKPASPEAVEAFRNAIMVGVELARKVNKEKEGR